MKRFTIIKCSECGTECKSGKAGHCDACYAKRAKLRREVAKKAKKSLDRKVGNVSEEKLWTACAAAIKRIYPLQCHGHLNPIPLERGSANTQACHFVRRGVIPTKYDPRNILPGCAYCNGFDQSHVHRLGIWIDHYWGEGTTNELRALMTDKPVKMSQSQKNSLFNMFNDEKLDRLETYYWYRKIMEGESSPYDGSTKRKSVK